ncbi:MAG: DUF4340 domain-containing protein [Anaerolineae bacterium]
MKFRNTIILLVLLIAVGGYAWYISQNQVTPFTGARNTPVPTPVNVFDVSTDSVTKFQVTDTKKNLTVSVTRQGQDWHMDQPKDSATDTIKILGAIGDLAHLDATRVLTNTTDLSQYGLDNPAIIATMTLSNTSQSVLKIGNATPDQGDYYALKGNDNQVYLVSAATHQGLADFLSDPPFPPTVTPTPLPTLPDTPTPAPGTGTPTASGTPAPAATP